MSPEIQDWVYQFEEAYASAFEAYKAAGMTATTEEYNQLGIAVMAARQLFEHLGYLDPFECGDCEACRANAETRREAVQRLVDTDPALSPKTHGTPLTAEEEATAARLLGDVFDRRPTRDES